MWCLWIQFSNKVHEFSIVLISGDWVGGSIKWGQYHPFQPGLHDYRCEFWVVILVIMNILAYSIFLGTLGFHFNIFFSFYFLLFCFLLNALKKDQISHYVCRHAHTLTLPPWSFTVTSMLDFCSSVLGSRQTYVIAFDLNNFNCGWLAKIIVF